MSRAVPIISSVTCAVLVLLYAVSAPAGYKPQFLSVSRFLGDSVQLVDCGTSDDVFKLQRIETSPFPPRVGENITLYAVGTAYKSIPEGAFVDLTFVYTPLFALHTERVDVCSHAADSELGACPLEPREYVLNMTLGTVPSLAPPGRYRIEARGKTSDNAGVDHDLVCADLTFWLLPQGLYFCAINLAASPEDILADTLASFIGQGERVSFGAPGDLYTHQRTGVVVSPPDTLASNWALHASAVWASAIFLADHIDELHIPPAAEGQAPFRVIELGAGAGLPGLAIAKAARYAAEVWLSDYPDPLLLHRLKENVLRNGVDRNTHVVGHAWGTESFASIGEVGERVPLGGFDLIVAADTLWNSEAHRPLCETLRRLLRASQTDLHRCGRAVLVAGLHTGRYAVQRFLDIASETGLEICELRERTFSGSSDTDGIEAERPWAAERYHEEEFERRRWLVWIVLRLAL
ncbi:hypothetical protein EXIGLDRAFT_833374 [Exidia glandulosa HHB12029]|uniref:Phosphatidylglycerol/phosphatidylinositol transfer protein n=1 Tax=Exidia glandulosa HHB12029 TaxID=1314781 RepID=A0A165KSF5_EXIGL|nr:hypothetical protein EXIGLDRAFT_833374 [Exidia glandulosa HHB12029]